MCEESYRIYSVFWRTLYNTTLFYNFYRNIAIFIVLFLGWCAFIYLMWLTYRSGDMKEIIILMTLFLKDLGKNCCFNAFCPFFQSLIMPHFVGGEEHLNFPCLSVHPKMFRQGWKSGGLLCPMKTFQVMAQVCSWHYSTTKTAIQKFLAFD